MISGQPGGSGIQPRASSIGPMIPTPIPSGTDPWWRRSCSQPHQRDHCKTKAPALSEGGLDVVAQHPLVSHDVTVHPSATGATSMSTTAPDARSSLKGTA